MFLVNRVCLSLSSNMVEIFLCEFRDSGVGVDGWALSYRIAMEVCLAHADLSGVTAGMSRYPLRTQLSRRSPCQLSILQVQIEDSLHPETLDHAGPIQNTNQPFKKNTKHRE